MSPYTRAMKPIEPAATIDGKGDNEPPKNVQPFWPFSAEGADGARKCLVAKTGRFSAVTRRKIPRAKAVVWTLIVVFFTHWQRSG